MNKKVRIYKNLDDLMQILLRINIFSILDFFLKHRKFKFFYTLEQEIV